MSPNRAKMSDKSEVLDELMFLKCNE